MSSIICKGTKSNGGPCGRKVKKGYEYCWQHCDQALECQAPIERKRIVYKTPIDIKIDNARDVLREADREVECANLVISRVDSNHEDINELIEHQAKCLFRQIAAKEDLERFEKQKKEMDPRDLRYKVRHFESRNKNKPKVAGGAVPKQINDNTFNRAMNYELRKHASKMRALKKKSSKRRQVTLQEDIDKLGHVVKTLNTRDELKKLQSKQSQMEPDDRRQEKIKRDIDVLTQKLENLNN